VLVDAKTGAIFVAALWSKGPRGWFGSGPGLTPEQTGQFVLCKSTDDGLTWTKPESITPQIKDPAWRLCFQGPGNGIQLRNGALVFPAQFKDAGGTAHSCFIASTDAGKSWKISPPAVPDKPPTSECAVAELSGNGLLLSMRNEGRSGQRLWAKWEWNGDVHSGKWGESWSSLPDPTCMGSLIRHPSGVLVFSNPAHAKSRVALTVRLSADDGRTWNAGRVIEPGGAMYSCLTVLKDGSLGLLYESSPDKGLVFARFPLSWIASADAPTPPPPPR
jgi:sialidase-1